MTAPEIVGVGAIFIDDIVHPDGQTFMERLGGGVVHALMGAAIWDVRPGIIALAGRDLPDSIRAHLERHLDIRGLRTINLPQIRAWQIFESDGTRRELYRMSDTAPFIAGAQPGDLPTDYQGCRAFYLLQSVDGIRAWRNAVSGMILWEPLQQMMIPGHRGLIRQILQDCQIDIISPNLSEAEAIYGRLSPDEVVDEMLNDGACIVALRMGAQGSIVASHEGRYRIPAVAVNLVIDQTGAGNTYCGAFLLGAMQGRTLQEAGLMAAVSASFCLEQVSTIDPERINREERDKRYRELTPL
jgi:sugar/nucleoside kinase (ribokinase family)